MQRKRDSKVDKLRGKEDEIKQTQTEKKGGLTSSA